MLTLVFDTETTGLTNAGFPADHPSQPGIVQLGAILYDDRKVVAELNVVTVPDAKGQDKDRIPIPIGATSVHGIDDAKVDRVGIRTNVALVVFAQLAEKADRLVAFNTAYDFQILRIALARGFGTDLPEEQRFYCAMLAAANHFKIPGRRPGQYAWPKLQDAYRKLVDPSGFDGAHDAMADVRAAAAVTWALEDAGVELVKI